MAWFPWPFSLGAVSGSPAPPFPGMRAPAPSRPTGRPKAITFRVARGNEDEEPWIVDVTEWMGVRRGGGLEWGRLVESVGFETKAEANRYARSRAAAAEGKYDVVRAIVTGKDRSVEARRRERGKLSDALTR